MSENYRGETNHVPFFTKEKDPFNGVDLRMQLVTPGERKTWSLVGAFQAASRKASQLYEAARTPAPAPVSKIVPPPPVV